MIIGFSIVFTFSATKANAENTNKNILYTIKKDDTFYLLGVKFNSSVNQIKALNPKVNPQNLKIGSKISIPVGSGIILHPIVKGDTLAKIALKYNTTVNTLAENNNIPHPIFIYPGDIIAINQMVQITGDWKSTNTTRRHGTKVQIYPTGVFPNNNKEFKINISAYNTTETWDGWEVPHEGNMEGKGTIINDKIHFIVDENMNGDIRLQNGKLLITYNGPRNYQAGITVYYDNEFIRK